METTDGTCVAVFTRHEDAEAAIRELQRGGFGTARVQVHAPS